MSEDAAIERDRAAVRVLLGLDAPPAELHPLGVLRPPSASTFVLLQQTLNEWTLGIPPEQMQNRHFAMLAWLYLMSVTPAEAGAVCFDPARLGAFDCARFTAAVLTWGDRNGADGAPLFTIPMVDAATRYLSAIMEMKKALEYDIERNPKDPPPEAKPPN